MATDPRFEKRTACLADKASAAVSATVDRGADLAPLAALDAPPGAWLSGVALYLARPGASADATGALHVEIRARYGDNDAETVVPETELSRWSGRGGSLWFLSGRRVKGVEVWGRAASAPLPCTVRFVATTDAAAPWFSQPGELV